MENQPQTFKTKLGFCHVFPDRIVLSKDGDYVKAEQNPNPDKRSKFIYYYFFLSVYLIFQSVTGYLDKQYFNAVASGFIAILLLTLVIKNFNNSGISVIKRSSIKNLKFNQEKKRLTRSYFVIQYTATNGKTRKRLIMLPGSLSNGTEATKKAVEIMKDEGYLMGN